MRAGLFVTCMNPAEDYMKGLNRGNTVAESADYLAKMKRIHKQILEVMLKDKQFSTEQIGEMASLKGSRLRELMK